MLRNVRGCVRGGGGGGGAGRGVGWGGGAGVCDPALRGVTGGWGVLVLVLRNAPTFIYQIMLFYCVDLPYYKKFVPASQHLKVIRNGVCYYNNSCLPFKNDILPAFR